MLKAMAFVLLVLLPVDPEPIPPPKAVPVVEPGCYLVREGRRSEPVGVANVAEGQVVAKWLSGQTAVGRRDADGVWWFGGTFGVMRLEWADGKRVGKWWNGDGVERMETWTRLKEE